MTSRTSALLSAARELPPGDDALWRGRRVIWKRAGLMGSGPDRVARTILSRERDAAAAAGQLSRNLLG